MGDVGHSAQKIYIAQGEHAIGRDPDMFIEAILGSCVAVCLWEERSRIGGMNHILLPTTIQDASGSFRFGAVVMEHLINDLAKAGVARGNLRAKIFGGAAMMGGLSDIGARNADFARDFLEREGIEIESESLGGDRARHVQFWPASGRARQKLVDSAPEPVKSVPKPAPASDVELF